MISRIITIPASVLVISEFSFKKCESLERLFFSNNSQLKEIKLNAFLLCISLKTISFPKSLKFLRRCAFNNCSALKTVVFPKDSQLEEISAAFPGTSIEHLSLPQSIRKITNVLSASQFISTMISSKATENQQQFSAEMEVSLSM